ncbi:MAG: hypothetical protein L0287_18285 [Anaerolineae bacterium]|nr:hypothetical protein [Anaerolineae bacterium]
MKADKILAEAARTYRQRSKQYKDNYISVGHVMAALFPNGVTLRTNADHERFHLIMLKIVKLTRYAINFSAGGHEDSIHDDCVYAAMLEATDKRHRHSYEESDGNRV